MQKQQEREQRRLSKKKKAKAPEDSKAIPEDVVLTMDMITDPNR